VAAGNPTELGRPIPPLYYALLAPIWLVSNDWSLYAQMLLLRSISYLFAWGSLVIVTVSINRKTPPPARDILEHLAKSLNR
jgi:hypothetical protein